MTFDSQTGREAQSKRKKHGTGGFLKKMQTDDPERYAAMQAAQVEKYGGPEGYAKEMKRRVELRWKNAKIDAPTPRESENK